MAGKILVQQKKKMMSEKKMRRKVTLKEMPFTGILTHLQRWNILNHCHFSESLKKMQNFNMNLFRVCARYRVMDSSDAVKNFKFMVLSESV